MIIFYLEKYSQIYFYNFPHSPPLLHNVRPRRGHLRRSAEQEGRGALGRLRLHLRLLRRRAGHRHLPLGGASRHSPGGRCIRAAQGGHRGDAGRIIPGFDLVFLKEIRHLIEFFSFFPADFDGIKAGGDYIVQWKTCCDEG